ncbi:ABC-2 transporter permease [Cytobacillus gottheilii]|uniref:ABC-2 transporter permease n=1 Tax=Cytobacillus gottheilii TaxID=859144 RepID=UPI0009BA3646|nr:ABC-2 transporter permease [Cytobacillus gottheilii]
MFSLVRKDLILQKSSILLLPVLCIYLTMNTSILWVGIVFSVVISLSSFSKDEKSPIHILFNSLPYTRKEIVSSKYIVTLIFTTGVALTILIGNYVINGVIVDWKVFLLMFCIVLSVISFIFPLSYQFKSGQLLMVTLIGSGIFIVVINLFVRNWIDQIRAFIGWLLALEGNLIYFMMAGAVFVLYAGSWLLSMYIYKKKVF